MYVECVLWPLYGFRQLSRSQLVSFLATLETFPEPKGISKQKGDKHEPADTAAASSGDLRVYKTGLVSLHSHGTDTKESFLCNGDKAASHDSSWE